jgi:hypothetical protein
MKTTAIPVGVLLGVAISLAISSQAVAQNVPASHVHIGHTADGWRDTPDGVGLLPAAAAEAAIAQTHAGLAAGSSGIDRVKLHIGHVENVIDERLRTGFEVGLLMGAPGNGYGVVKGASGAATHIGLAAGSEGASDNVKLHANHVGTSLGNVQQWAQEILQLAARVESTSDAAMATDLAGQIHELTQRIVDGHDADGDGRIGWGSGEGGLAQATLHLDLLKRGEGIN